MAKRSEIRQYQDSHKYLYKGGVPVLSLGGSLAFQYNNKWRFESGLISTPYYRSAAVYYNEPGYKRILNRPLMSIGNTNTLEIPLKVVYSPSISWKSIQVNLLGGFNTYLLTDNINAWGEAGLPSIPVSPSPPTNLSAVYNTRNLSKINYSLEAGIEAMWHLGNRLIFIYRFTGRIGFTEMAEMEGNYITGQNIAEKSENIYPFRIISRGSALHHTFSLRYKMGKDKTKDNW
jgi:hypothetical protein